MEQLSIAHQTLDQFLKKPFGFEDKASSLDYENRYLKFKKENKIQVESAIEFEKHWFVHFHVPSESQKGQTYYDVVIEFFAPDKETEKEVHIRNYYVQFFSNSPGFVYKYASLYKLQGYLIESLYDKFDAGTLEVLPDKANKTYKLFYDSSIYYACRYVQDHQIAMTGKFNLKILKKKSPQRFFEDIQDFESVNLSRDVNKMTENLKKEIVSDDKKLSHYQEQKLKKLPFFGKEIIKKRSAQRSTFKKKENESKVKKPSLFSGSKSSIVKKSGTQKVRAKNTTKKG